MMKYELFKEVITERILDFMPPIFSDFEPKLEIVPKVNGAKDALVLTPPDHEPFMALPIVYLDDMYEIFQLNEDMDDMLSFIAGIFISFTGSVSQEELDVDFRDKSDSVVMSIINSDANSELLEDIPHIDVLNMSLIFRVIMRWCGDGFDSVIMNNHIMTEMGVGRNELFELAMENSRRLFPPTIEYLDEDMYVISNSGRTFGAVSMVYEDFMKEVGKTVGDDRFYILPTSIHEFFAVAEKDADIEALIEMLASGNSCITKKHDVLSNAVYTYDIHKGSICKAASYH